jgi:hypothetical protein
MIPSGLVEIPRERFKQPPCQGKQTVTISSDARLIRWTAGEASSRVQG